MPHRNEIVHIYVMLTFVFWNWGIDRYLQNRAVAVHPASMTEVLKKRYAAQKLVDELSLLEFLEPREHAEYLPRPTGHITPDINE